MFTEKHLKISRAYRFMRRWLDAMQIRHKRLLWGGLVLIAASSGVLLFKTLNSKDSSALGITCQSTKYSGIQETIYLNGLINPAISVNLTSEKTGRISRLFVKEGFPVKRGQVVALLDYQDVDNQIRIKEKEIASLRQKLIRLEQRASRIDSLSKQGLMPITDKEEAEAKIFDDRANLARSESQLMTLRREKLNNVIVAPFDGTVAQIFAFPGTFVSPMTSASDSDQSSKSTIMQIYSQLQAVINSPEAIVFDILNSKDITVSPTTDTRIKVPARIERVMPYVVLTRDKINAIPIRLDIADASPFLPGMGVDISILKKPITGLGVKTHAIVRKDGENGLLECNSLKFYSVEVLGESDGTSIVSPSAAIKLGFRYSTVGAPSPSPPSILDYFGKEGIEKLKQGMDVNPMK